MPIKCRACPIRRRELFEPMSEDDIEFMERFKIGEMTVEAGTPLLSAGANAPQLFTALDGFGVRFQILPDGRRQVLNFVFPGDFIGLQAGVMHEMAHDVEAVTAMTLCVFNRRDLWSLFRHHPGRAYDLTWLAATEKRFLGEALTSVGQRSAVESMAWALSRVFRRLDALGLRSGNTVPLPYRQQDLADALGLSLVHTNKTLAKLRDRQILSWSDGRLSVSDIDALEDLGLVDTAMPPRRPLM